MSAITLMLIIAGWLITGIVAGWIFGSIARVGAGDHAGVDVVALALMSDPTKGLLADREPSWAPERREVITR